jgi:trimethylamine--corrinoid protein Co-methyltransferase
MNLLSRTEIDEIDASGRELLQRVGIKVMDPQVCRRLADAGAKVDMDELRVRMPDTWLEKRLKNAPNSFTLYGRDSANDLVLGKNQVHFGNGGRVFQLLDMESGRMRPTLLYDIADAAALVEQLKHIRFFIIPCQACDLPPEDYHLNDFFQALAHTTKHIMGGCDHLAGVKQAHQLAIVVAGGKQALLRRPIVSVITNPISPLTLDTGTLQIMSYCARNGIPLTCAPAPMAGATAPATLGGTLAQLHAEALAGVAVIQFYQPGAAALYGAVPSTMDLRTMNLAIGSVETSMLNTAAVALAQKYGLPIYASAGLTDSKLPDVQAGFEKGVSNLLLGLAGADFIHLAAGMLDSGNAIALEQYIIDDEILGMIHRILRGIDISKETLAVDCVEKVGPGGNYVMEAHTLEHMMDQFFYPSLSVRMPYDLWTQKERPTPVTRAREQVASILAEHQTMLDEDTLKKIHNEFPQLRSPQPPSWDMTTGQLKNAPCY